MHLLFYIEQEMQFHFFCILLCKYIFSYIAIRHSDASEESLRYGRISHCLR